MVWWSRSFAVDDEEDFVDAFHASGELRGLEGGEGLSGTRRVPDVSSGSDGAGLLVHGGCLDTLEDRLGGGDLIGTHHQELSTSIEHAIASEDCEDGALSQEGEPQNRVRSGIWLLAASVHQLVNS